MKIEIHDNISDEIAIELVGIVGERIWDLEGGAYLDYCNRVKPILNKRIAWYKKQNESTRVKSVMVKLKDSKQ